MSFRGSRPKNILMSKSILQSTGMNGGGENMWIIVEIYFLNCKLVLKIKPINIVSFNNDPSC